MLEFDSAVKRFGTVAALDVEHFLASLGEAGSPDTRGDQIENLAGADAA